MKQISGVTLLVVAIVCGLIAAGLTVFYMEQIESKYKLAAQPPKLETQRVVMVRKNMLKGEKLREADIGALAIPVKYLPSNAVLAKDYKKVINRTLMLPVEGGRPVTWDLLTGVNTDTFSDVIKQGRRAKSIKIKKIDSFDGLLRPGDIIDIMGTFAMVDLGMPISSSSKGSTDIVMPVLERVEVLEAARVDLNGTRYEVKANKNSADGVNLDFTLITLNLTPRQVARVEMANITGQISAVLRNTLDTSTANYEYLGVELLREADVAELIDIVLDANGNPIGRVIGDNVVDSEGNIVGKIVDGKAVGLDGKPLGRIVENVSSDDAINRVDQIADVVRDEDGNIIGTVSKVVRDADGNVIGRVINGKVVDANGNVVGRQAEIVRDADGNAIGRVVDGKIVDDNGRVIGEVGADGVARSLNGETMGSIETAMIGSNGRVLGTIEEVVLDKAGNVIGTMKDGKPMGANGQALGTIERGVALDKDGRAVDINNSRSASGDSRRGKVVRDANGNVVGRVVNGQVVDSSGRVIGKIGKNGTAVGIDGKSLGTVEEVVIDRSGNVVGREQRVVRDADGNVVGSISRVIRDADGKVVGRVVNGQVVDSSGKVIGKISKDGTAMGIDGQSLGTVEEVVIDRSGNVVGREQRVVRDADGNVVGSISRVIRDADGKVVGRVVNGQVVDSSGKVIGKISKDGTAMGIDGQSLGTVEEVVIDRSGNVVGVIDVNGVARSSDGTKLGSVETIMVDKDGSKLGSVETVMVDKDGNITATVSEVVKDAQGNVIGRVIDGQVVDANGNVVGQIVNGQAVDSNGNVIGELEKVVVGENGRELQSSVEVIRDAEGNIIGTLINGEVVDKAGNVIGQYKDGQIVSSKGNVLYDNVSLTSEAINAVAAELRTVSLDRGTSRIRIVDFIPGGSAKDGITPVIKVRVE